MIDNLLKCGFCQDWGVCFLLFCIHFPMQLRSLVIRALHMMKWFLFNIIVPFFFLEKRNIYSSFKDRNNVGFFGCCFFGFFFWYCKNLLNFCPSQNKTRQSIITIKKLITGLKVITIVIMRHLVFQKHKIPVPYA